MYEGYPFIFQMNDYSDSNKLLELTMQYRFKSSRSNHTYIVRVEKYVEHTYCVKFFDKANSQVMTNIAYVQQHLSRERLFIQY